MILLKEVIDHLFVKGYGFLSFTYKIFENIGKDINKSIIGKYRQNLLDDVKQFATDALKTASAREKKKAEFKKQKNQVTI